MFPIPPIYPLGFNVLPKRQCLKLPQYLVYATDLLRDVKYWLTIQCGEPPLPFLLPPSVHDETDPADLNFAV